MSWTERYFAFKFYCEVGSIVLPLLLVALLVGIAVARELKPSKPADPAPTPRRPEPTACRGSRREPDDGPGSFPIELTGSYEELARFAVSIRDDYPGTITTREYDVRKGYYLAIRPPAAGWAGMVRQMVARNYPRNRVQ